MWRQPSNPPKKLLIRNTDIHSAGTNNTSAIFHWTIACRQVSQQNGITEWKRPSEAIENEKEKHPEPSQSEINFKNERKQRGKKKLAKYRFEFRFLSSY